ncbi:MAG: VWA domain-containing protein [Candidatus Delongbacteria bacterium]|jgi:Ca-activated chloride channel family protein|nr:VWA domain-containing protein [Candidatus Delongbacteria bacterium]
MERLKFTYPEYIHLLWISIILIIFFYFMVSARFKTMDSFLSDKMKKMLADSVSSRKILFKKILQILGFTLIVIALIGPQLGMRLVNVKRQGIDIVVAIDLSKSMLAQDIIPSRIKKTKHVVKNFINKLEGDRIGLVGFTSRAFLQSPLTSDYDAALMFLDIMDTSLLPQNGTSLSEAITTSTSAFVAEDKKHKLLILISDGEDHEEGFDEAVKAATEKGIVIYTIGIGSLEGVPIPTDKGFIKDNEGKTVISKLNEIDLKKIAAEGNGNYYLSTSSEGELEDIFNDIARIEKKEFGTKLFKDFEHRYQVILLIGVILLMIDLAMNERKKIKKVQE